MASRSLHEELSSAIQILAEAGTLLSLRPRARSLGPQPLEGSYGKIRYTPGGNLRSLSRRRSQKGEIAHAREVISGQEFERQLARHPSPHLDDSPRRHVAMLAERRRPRAAAMAWRARRRSPAAGPRRRRVRKPDPAEKGSCKRRPDSPRRRGEPSLETLRGPG